MHQDSVVEFFSNLFQGFIWHGGKLRQYTKPFRENVATTVGIFFDGIAGTMTYFKDGVSLGVAFDRLNDVSEPLYPIVCSTAAKTEMFSQMTEAHINFMLSKIPMNRFVTVEEIAAMICWMAMMTPIR